MCILKLINWFDFVVGNMGIRVEFIVLLMLGASWVCHSREMKIMNPFAGKTHSGKKKVHHYLLYSVVNNVESLE